MTFVTVFPSPEGVVNLFNLLWFLDLFGVFVVSSKGVFKEAAERVLTRDISGELDPMPGQVVVNSRLVTEVLFLGRERLPRLLFLPGVSGPGLLQDVFPAFKRFEERILVRENEEDWESYIKTQLKL